MAKVTKRRGKWVVDYRLNGRRLVPSFPTKRAAEDFYRELKLREANPSFAKALNSSSLRDAINRYFDLVSKKKTESTQIAEKRYFENFFEFFGDIEVTNINLVGLEEFRDWLSQEKQLGNSSINRYFNTYKNFFSKCEDWGFINKSPAHKLKSLRERRSQKRLWKDEEIEEILANAQPWAKEAFYVLALTGVRRGELASLTWKMVNFDFRTIEVHSTKGTGDDRVRYIPMTDELHSFLQAKWDEAKRSFRSQGSSPVFLNASGRQVTPTHLSRELSRLCKKLGFVGLNLHGLRHTWVTRMVSSKVGLATTMKLAGHTNLKTTQGYLHISDDQLHTAMIEGSKARVIRLK